jgi:hypothetical protein
MRSGDTALEASDPGVAEASGLVQRAIERTGQAGYALVA